MGKAMVEIGQDNNNSLKVFSMHDHRKYANEIYFPAKIFRGFNGNKFRFVVSSVIESLKSRVVVLSHINLLLVGWLIKLISPATKLYLVAHGIEVWKPLTGFKKRMLSKVDSIICVSHFTKEKIKLYYQLPEKAYTILNNCLDPFLNLPPDADEINSLRKKYGFAGEDFVMLTLSRLSATETGKGYDKILFSLKELHTQNPNLRYLFVGKYDEIEKSRLDKLIAGYGLTNIVVFTGFIPDKELAAHYSIADLYIMPSEKEGFGISFIEAMYYGIPVIAGNRDGSVDALLNGKLGILVDPRNQDEITLSIKKVIGNKKAFIPCHELLMKNFSYPVYKNNLQQLLYGNNV